ncbi:hypothetical protein ACFTAO_04095 [Paenibacillus rhizoplanae]
MLLHPLRPQAKLPAKDPILPLVVAARGSGAAAMLARQQLNPWLPPTVAAEKKIQRLKDS